MPICRSKRPHWKVAKPRSLSRQPDFSFCFKPVLYMAPRAALWLWLHWCQFCLAPDIQHNVKVRGENLVYLSYEWKDGVSLFNHSWKFCLFKSTCILSSEIILQKLTNTFVILTCWNSFLPLTTGPMLLTTLWSISNSQIKIILLRAKVRHPSLVPQFFKKDVNLFFYLATVFNCFQLAPVSQLHIAE